MTNASLSGHLRELRMTDLDRVGAREGNPRKGTEPCLYTARKTAMIFFTGRYARNSLIPLSPTS